MEADEVDVVSAAVFCDFQEIEDAQKSGRAGEFGGDVGETDGLDRVDLDFAFFHAVTVPNSDARGLPDADTACDVAGADTVAKAPGKEHEESLFRLRRSAV